MSTSASGSRAKKRFYPAFILTSCYPLVIMLILNTVFTIPAVAIGIYKMVQEENYDFSDITAVLASPEAQMALTIGFILYAITAIIIFYIWYKKVFLKHQITIDNKTAFSVKRVVLSVLLIIGTSSLITLALFVLEDLAPSVMESYSRIMNGVGLGSNFLTTLLYACLLGPIAEELMFRAVTQGYLRRAGLNTAAVIIIQAVLFGIAHLNLVQSTYAVLFGLSLGLLRHKYGNIRITCLAHIVFNVFGTFGFDALMSLDLPRAVYYAVYGIFVAAGIAAAVLVFKEPVKDIDLYKTPEVSEACAPASSPA